MAVESGEVSPELRAHELILQRAYHPSGEFSAFTEIDRGRSPARLLEAHAERASPGPVLSGGGTSWSYPELNARANGIARALREGPGAGEAPVGLVIGSCPEMVGAVLGALKAGRTFVPIDPIKTPIERAKFILGDAGVSTILTVPRHHDLVGRLSPGPVVLDVTAIPESPQVLADEPSSSDVAWILYTSGSTGQPKGVSQTYANVSFFLTTEADQLHVCARDHSAISVSSSVNLWYRETLSALVKGAAATFIDIQTEGFAGLADGLTRDPITLAMMVPSLFRQFAPTLSTQPPCLRVLKLGGEPVLRTDVDLYRRHFSRDCVLANRFGTTETGPVRYYLMDHDTQVTTAHAPIGYPVAGSELLVQDADGREVAPGESGELVVRSGFLTMGYWKRPDLTESIFRADPDDPSMTLYFTGDVGTIRQDGLAMHLGRRDQQVQIRGYRVELAEIEIRLRALEAIDDGAVAAFTSEGRDGEETEVYLVGYVVAAAPPSAGELQATLAEALPDYMVPSRWVFLDQLPRAPNGKLARRALPRPEPTTGGTDGKTEFVSPSTSMEERIAHHWRSVLPEVERIGRDDRFFQLGGHSLDAMRVINRIQDDVGIRLVLSDLGLLSLAELAARCERGSSEG